MKQALFQLQIALMLALLLSGCTSTLVSLDDKYRFEGLETVKRVSAFRINGWNTIDSQSLIIYSSPKKRYLVILQRPERDLRFAHSLQFTTTGNSVHARFDCVKVKRYGCGPDPIPVPIHSIYRLNSKADIERVKRQIRGE